MTIGEHLDQFFGLPIHNFSAEQGLASPAEVAVRLALDWDAHEQGVNFHSLFSSYLDDPRSVKTQALVIGDWGGAAEGEGSELVVEALVAARSSLPNLRALFLAELTYEESEISWISQSDISPLFEAFPQLEEFYVRGGVGLSLGRPKHSTLRKLVIETGGLPGEIAREVTAAQLPALEHLELWLGDEGYGNDVTADDLIKLLEDGPVGGLRYLGLRDDSNADETARLLAEQGIPALVETLDLSLGVLGDEGAEALIACDWIKQLKHLDIHHHYVSPEVVSRLQQAVGDLNAEERQEPDRDGDDTYRYVAVSE